MQAVQEAQAKELEAVNAQLQCLNKLKQLKVVISSYSDRGMHRLVSPQCRHQTHKSYH